MATSFSTPSPPGLLRFTYICCLCRATIQHHSYTIFGSRWVVSEGGTTTTGPDATHPPAIYQNWGGVLPEGGGVWHRVEGGGGGTPPLAQALPCLST